MCFEQHGVQYSPSVIRARRDGSVETDIPLISIPAYSRARAIATKLFETMSEDDIQSICLCNAESHAILQALESAGSEELDLTEMTLFPCVVPDRGVSDETMDSAMAILHEMIDGNQEPKSKPWWKLW